ncbi:MAG: phage baseplate protein [Methanotrichaceae archaeon]
MLSYVFPEISQESLDNLSLGQQNSLLLRIRNDLFGPDLQSVVTCPRCKENLELNFPLLDEQEGNTNIGGEIQLSQGGYDLRFRLPRVKDLIELSEAADVSSANIEILDRCLIEARYLGESCKTEQLPQELIEAISELMSERDPQSNIQLSISCPLCHHSWEEDLDIASFLWAEIDAWAYRTLREVHALSLSYGWSEADILALSPLRRRIYLEMVYG